MKKIRIKRLLIISLVLVEIITIFLSVKSFGNKPIKNIKEENNIKRNKFSMYLENNNGEYEEYTTSNVFPTGYKINLDKSTCVDTAGKEVNGILSGNGSNVMVTSNKTVFCYIYFDKPTMKELCMGEELGSCLADNVSYIDNLWDSNLEDDGVRFIGTNPNNYICFGTIDKNECINNTDKYMYRIIGVFDDGNGRKDVKLIKKEALNMAYAWDSDSASVGWNNSDLNKGLQESYFLTNPDYSYMQQRSWKNKIKFWNYTITKAEYHLFSTFFAKTAQEKYLYELNKSNKYDTRGSWTNSNFFAGLMYVSDYELSLGNLNSTGGLSWMHLSNNDNAAPSNDEWTMTGTNDTPAIYVGTDGNMYLSGPQEFKSVRPTFYLRWDELYNSGSGTISDPIMLTKPVDDNAASDLLNNASSTELESTSLEDDGYRYVGTNPNNYICFGTTDKDTCVNDTGKYMYRIIGIFEDELGNEHLKLIKKEAIYGKRQWHSSASSDIDWNNSSLYQGINGSYFLTNSNYMPSGWANKISTWNYTMTNTITWKNYSTSLKYGVNYYFNTGEVIYLHELNRSELSSQTCYFNSGTTVDCSIGQWNNLSGKISLMYVSDYALSTGNSAINYNSVNNSSAMKTGWMHLSNNDSNFTNSPEWTMSRVDKNGSYYSWIIQADGAVNNTNVNLELYVRPVFYLESNVELNGGTGKANDPYLIKLDN